MEEFSEFLNRIFPLKARKQKKNFDIFKFWRNSICLFPSFAQPLCTYEKTCLFLFFKTCFKLESPTGLLGFKKRNFLFKKILSNSQKLNLWCKDVLSTCHYVKWLFCQPSFLSTCYFVNLLLCKIAIFPSGCFVNCFFINMCQWAKITLPPHFLAILSSWFQPCSILLNLPLHQLAISSNHHFIKWLFHQLLLHELTISFLNLNITIISST